jgi:predicted nucleotidyltransferase
MLTETQISALRETLQNYPQVLFAYLFGSQATGKVTPISDVDIAVYIDEHLNSSEQFKLQLHLVGVLCQALQRNDVEVAVLNDTDVVLRYQVLKNGRIIFCRDKAAKNEFFVRTISEYLDAEPMRAFHREKMKEQIKEGKFSGRSQRYAKAARQAARIFGAFAGNR